MIKALRYRVFVLSFLIALMSSLSLWWILQHQGWNLSQNKTYFRPPMNHDVERHLILVNGFMRDTSSPFLANSKIFYQTAWHQLIAAAARSFKTHLDYSEFRWVVLGSGFCFIFSLVYLLGSFRPSFILRKQGFWILFALVGLHADIFSFFASLYFQHLPGIEADWSFKGPLIFRNISIPVLALTSPQHCLFLIVALLLLTLRRNRWQGILLGISFVLSPPLALLFCGPYFLWRFMKAKRVFWELLQCMFVAPFSFKWVYGYDLLEFFGRPGTLQLSWFPSWIGHWMNLPFILIGTLGGIGLFLSVLFSRGLLKIQSRFVLAWILFTAFLFYNVVTDIELRRHVSILLSVLTLYFIARNWPILTRTLKSRFSPTAQGLGFSLLIVLHGYFVYSFTMKPSVVSQEVAWHDYLEMNGVIRNRFPKMRVLAATDSHGMGLSFPLVMEATTSFASPLDASVHSLLSPKQTKQMISLSQGESVLKHARELGYEAFIWGPVEQKVWGDEGMKYLGTFNSLAQIGKVGLYGLENSTQLPIKSIN